MMTQTPLPVGTYSPQGNADHGQASCNFSTGSTIGSYSASATGSTTITFTWQPDAGKDMTTDPPPPYVILAKTATASLSGTNNPILSGGTTPGGGGGNSGGGGGDNFTFARESDTPKAASSAALTALFCDERGGLGESGNACGGDIMETGEDGDGDTGPQMTVTASVSIGDYGTAPTFPPTWPLSVTGTKYEVKDSTSGTVSVTSPSMSATISGNSNGTGSFSASISFSANITSVWLVLSGTTKDAALHDHILVGQGAGASIVLGDGSNARTAFGNALVGDKFNWAVTGDTFQQWSDKTPQSVEPDWTQQRRDETAYYLGGPGDLTIPKPGWYWNDPPPASGHASNSETVSCIYSYALPDGQNYLSIYLSTNVSVYVPGLVANEWSGYVALGLDPSVNQQGFGIWTTATPQEQADGHPAGATFRATVTTPQSPIAFGKGRLEYVQKITNQNHAYWRASPTGGPDVEHDEPDKGKQGLDAVYPYDGPRNEIQGKFQTTDVAGFPISSIMTKVRASRSFTMYVMYCPPGGTWVPLANLGWGANSGVIPQPNSGWSPYTNPNAPSGYPSNYAGSVTPVGNPPNSPTPFVRSNDFPMWDMIITGGAGGIGVPW